MNKGDQKLRTRILALETEYRTLIASETSTLTEMHRIDEIEQLLFYVRDWKWEAVRERLLKPDVEPISEPPQNAPNNHWLNSTLNRKRR